jgi:chromosome segregation ATPase
MEYSTPNEDLITMSPAVQNKIIAIREQINDKEQELVRLNTEIVSKEYTIQQLSNRMAELNDLVPKLEAKKKEIDKSILVLVSEQQKAMNNLDEVKIQTTNLSTELETRKSIVEKMEEKMQDDINSLAKEKEQYAIDKKKIEDREEVLAEKIIKLKSIIN